MKALEKDLGREFEDIVEQKLEESKRDDNELNEDALRQNLGHLNINYRPMIETVTQILEDRYILDDGETKIASVNKKSSEIQRKARDLPKSRNIGSSFGRGLTLLYNILDETDQFEVRGVIGESTGVSKKYPLAGISYSREPLDKKRIDELPEKEAKEAWMDVKEGLDEAYFNRFIPSSRF
jgi:hypothetical protein